MEDSEEKALRIHVERLFRNACAELARQQGVEVGRLVAGVEPAGNVRAVVVAAERQNILCAKDCIMNRKQFKQGSDYVSAMMRAAKAAG